MIAYAISDPSTLNFQTLTDDLIRFSAKATMVVYRDKSTSEYAKNAKIFLDEARKYSFEKILLHTDYQLAYHLGAEGIHLTSKQESEIVKAKELGLFVVISTHTKEEALMAQELGADMITFSPIFATPNKGTPKGLKELSRVTSILSVPLIALGGIITTEQIALCQESGAKGFASIRWFSD
jgi:thiamine-phosphate pyrophosphorylase